MAVLGVQMMMVRDKVAEDGMRAVLQKIRDLGYDAVEISQIPMDEENTAALEWGRSELGLDVDAAHQPAVAIAGSLIADNCRRIGSYR